MTQPTDLPATQRPASGARPSLPAAAETKVRTDGAHASPPSTQTPADPAILGLRRRDVLFVGLVSTAALLLLIAHWARLSGWGRHPVEIERLPERRFDFRLDVNRATWVEWMQLEGIGETLAMRIVEDRDANGPFSSVDDVQRVKGIGPKTLEAIRPWLVCEPVNQTIDHQPEKR